MKSSIEIYALRHVLVYTYSLRLSKHSQVIEREIICRSMYVCVSVCVCECVCERERELK